jgi:acyl-CoA thioesterase II
MSSGSGGGSRRDKGSGKSLFDALVGSDRAVASTATQLAKVDWIGRALGQLFTDSARVDASGEPPKANQFNHVELEEIDVNLYRARKEDLWLGPNPTKRSTLYGGQLIGQSLNAASRSVKKDSAKVLHSLHAYFLNPGTNISDVVFQVLPVNDGRSFATRWVIAQQRGVPIFTLQASYQIPEPSPLSHQMQMPKVPPPEQIPTEGERYRRIHDDERCPEPLKKVLLQRMQRPNPIEVRYVESLDYFGSPNQPTESPPTQIVWMRAKERLGDDPNVHAAVIAYCSDLTLLATVRGSQSALDISMVASLDHSMWFHRRCRADEWLLYVTTSPRATGGRGLAYGYIFDASGVLCVSVAQEGLMRFRANHKL